MRISILLLLLVGCTPLSQRDSAAQIAGPSDALRERFGLSDFYQQHVDIGGLPVLASKRVQPAARVLLWKSPFVDRARAVANGARWRCATSSRQQA